MNEKGNMSHVYYYAMNVKCEMNENQTLYFNRTLFVFWHKFGKQVVLLFVFGLTTEV